VHLEESFAREFNRMLEILRLESKLVLARYSSQIAVKMVSLAMEEDSEIARQACMDVINHPDFKEEAADTKSEKSDRVRLGPDGKMQELPPELASKLLKALTDDTDPPSSR
jgi:23S rRNA G2069 N7-methylase RlmK/C1962 C5-methylase RlmI